MHGPKIDIRTYKTHYQYQYLISDPEFTTKYSLTYVKTQYTYKQYSTFVIIDVYIA